MFPIRAGAKYLCIFQELNKSLLHSDSSNTVGCAAVKTSWSRFSSGRTRPPFSEYKTRVAAWIWHVFLKRLKGLEIQVYLTLKHHTFVLPGDAAKSRQLDFNGALCLVPPTPKVYSYLFNVLLILTSSASCIYFQLFPRKRCRI